MSGSTIGPSIIGIFPIAKSREAPARKRLFLPTESQEIDRVTTYVTGFYRGGYFRGLVLGRPCRYSWGRLRWRFGSASDATDFKEPFQRKPNP